MSEARTKIKGSIDAHIFAFCSKCGSPNHYVHTITEEQEFEIVFDSKTSNEAAKRKLAEPKLQEKLIASRTQFIRKVESGDYRALNCTCANCKHVDPWSQHNASGLSCFALILGAVSFLSLIGVFFGLVFCVGLLMLALPAFICMLIINGRRNKHFSDLTKTMDRRNLPIIAEDMEKLRQKVEAAFPGEEIVIPH